MFLVLIHLLFRAYPYFKKHPNLSLISQRVLCPEPPKLGFRPAETCLSLSGRAPCRDQNRHFFRNVLYTRLIDARTFFSKYAACWMSCSLCHFYCCRLKLLRSINLSTCRNIKWPAQNMNKLRFFSLDPWHWAKVVSHAGDWEPVVTSDICNDHLFAAQTLPNEQEIIKIRCHHDMTPGPCKLLTLLTALIPRSSCQNSQRGLIGDIGLSPGPVKC